MHGTLVLAVVLSMPSASALRWQLDNFLCDGDDDPFTNVDITVLCNGVSSSGAGDSAVVSGTVRADQAFSNDYVTVKLCAAGICPDRLTKRVGKLCDVLTPLDDDQSCGDAGDYEISDKVKVPKEGNIPSSVWNVVTVKAQIGDEDACEGTANGNSALVSEQMGSINNEGGVSTSFMLLLLAFIATVAAAAIYIERRRNHAAAVDASRLTEDVERNGGSGKTIT